MAETLVHTVAFSHLHLEQVIDEVDSYGETERPHKQNLHWLKLNDLQQWTENQRRMERLNDQPAFNASNFFLLLWSTFPGRAMQSVLYLALLTFHILVFSIWSDILLYIRNMYLIWCNFTVFVPSGENCFHGLGGYMKAALWIWSLMSSSSLKGKVPLRLTYIITPTDHMSRERL